MSTSTDPSERTILVFGVSAQLRSEVLHRIQTASKGELKTDPGNAGATSLILPQIIQGLEHLLVDAGNGSSMKLALPDSMITAVMLVVDLNTWDQRTPQNTSRLEADLSLCSALSNHVAFAGKPLFLWIANIEACGSRMSAEALRTLFPSAQYGYNAGEDPAFAFVEGGEDTSTQGSGFFFTLFSKHVREGQVVHGHLVRRHMENLDWVQLRSSIGDSAS